MVDDNKETKVKTIEEYHERAPRRWPVLVIYLIIALLVAGLLVFGARGIYRHYHKSATKTVQANKRPTEPATNAPGSSNTTNSSSGSKNNSSPQSANSQSASTSGTLPNSGPGQVVGLFIGASLAAAGLHYVINLRRNSRAS